MKQQILAVPNSINDALDAIDQLVTVGMLEPASADVLRLVYVWGWSDGFSVVRRANASLVFGMRPGELKAALTELTSRGFIQLRDAGDHFAIEATSLSTGAVAPGCGISWWRFYHVDPGREGEHDG
jgi:hypothetical protein